MSEEKKNPPRAQIFRYFRIESRNKYGGGGPKTCIFVRLHVVHLLYIKFLLKVILQDKPLDCPNVSFCCLIFVEKTIQYLKIPPKNAFHFVV